MIKLGTYHTLRILRHTDPGIYLEGDETTGDILLPKRYVTPQMHDGDELEVFIYLDQDERIIATTERPLAQVGQFAYLEVAWTNQYGAFLNWGLMKDLFCPFREQKQRMQRGKGYIVYIKEDEASHRLMATAKVEKYLTPLYPPEGGRSNAVESQTNNASDRGGYHVESLPNNASPLRGDRGGYPVESLTDNASPLRGDRGGYHSQRCDCLIWQKTDLGFKAIVDNRYQGQLYDNQLFQPLHTGDRLTAYIDHIRQDGKIDLTLQPTGHRQTLDFAEVLLRYLHENNGRCNLGDHSPAELIADRFQVSKKVFKRAVGDLYRRRLITLSDDGICLA